MAANQFDEAELSVEKAIQVARFSEGLFAKEQYPLLELEIDISRSRQDWEDAASKLQHFAYLIAEKYEGESTARLETLGWLADKHLQCALNIASTIIETKTTALDRRYSAGLEKLQMLRDGLIASGNSNPEAIGMAEIYIADWKLAFNDYDDAAAEYHVARELLLEAGITELQLDDFFAQPAVIPRSQLTLSFTDALAQLEDGNELALASARIDDTAVAMQGRQLRIVESSDVLPGVVSERETDGLNRGAIRDWSTVSLTMVIDPTRASHFRSRGYYVKSNVIPSTIAVNVAPNLSDKAIKAVISRVKTNSFRPVLQHGQPVVATFSVDYVFRHNEKDTLQSLLTML